MPIKDVKIIEEVIKISSEHDCSADINKLLITNGIMVKFITKEELKLEELFLQTIENGGV